MMKNNSIVRTISDLLEDGYSRKDSLRRPKNEKPVLQTVGGGRVEGRAHEKSIQWKLNLRN